MVIAASILSFLAVFQLRRIPRSRFFSILFVKSRGLIRFGCTYTQVSYSSFQYHSSGFHSPQSLIPASVGTSSASGVVSGAMDVAPDVVLSLLPPYVGTSFAAVVVFVVTTVFFVLDVTEGASVGIPLLASPFFVFFLFRFLGMVDPRLQMFRVIL
jgi:hypothetical protein